MNGWDIERVGQYEWKGCRESRRKSMRRRSGKKRGVGAKINREKEN